MRHIIRVQPRVIKIDLLVTDIQLTDAITGWDVAEALGVAYSLPDDVVEAALPLALSVSIATPTPVIAGAWLWPNRRLKASAMGYSVMTASPLCARSMQT